MTTPLRDPRTGVIAFDDLTALTAALRTRVAEVLRAGHLPFVVGGDCALLPGTLAGARDRVGRIGLAFIDGHLDACDGDSSPTGEAADMDLAFVTGHAPPELDAVLGHKPVVLPEDVHALGYRLEEPWVRLPGGGLGREADLVDPGVHIVTSARVRERGAASTGAEVAQRLGRRRGIWLHLDIDVLDESVMPAVSYPQPEGLDWDELEALARPLAASPRLAGITLTCFNPDLDADAALARRIAGLVGALLEARAIPPS
jgi:arginase